MISINMAHCNNYMFLDLLLISGKAGNVPKGTKIVMPIKTNKSHLDSSNSAKWDVVVYRQTGNTLILQVNIYILEPCKTIV